MPKALLKNYSCGPDTEIYGPGPPREYSGWTNIIDAIGLMNLSTMAPLAFPRALSTVVANDVYKLPMINASGGVYLPTFSLLLPGRTNFTYQLLALPLLLCPEDLRLYLVLGVLS